MGVLRKSAEAGAQFAVCFFGVTLRSGNREYYFAALERAFPGVRDKYLKTFGNAYECPAPNARRLFELFQAECTHLGLLWRFRDINEAMIKNQARQLSLWD